MDDYDTGTDWSGDDDNANPNNDDEHSLRYNGTEPRQMDHHRLGYRNAKDQARIGEWLILNHPRFSDYILVSDMFSYDGEARLHGYIRNLCEVERRASHVALNVTNDDLNPPEQAHKSSKAPSFMSTINGGRPVLKRRINLILCADSWTLESSNRKVVMKYNSYENHAYELSQLLQSGNYAKWGYVVLCGINTPPVDVSHIDPELLMVIGLGGCSDEIHLPSVWEPKAFQFELAHPWNPKASALCVIDTTVVIDPSCKPFHHINSIDVRKSDFMMLGGDSSVHLNTLTKSHFPNIKYYRGYVADCPSVVEYSDCRMDVSMASLVQLSTVFPRLKGVTVKGTGRIWHPRPYTEKVVEYLKRHRSVTSIHLDRTNLTDTLTSTIWTQLWWNRDLEYHRLEASASIAALLHFGLIDDTVAGLVFRVAMSYIDQHKDEHGVKEGNGD